MLMVSVHSQLAIFLRDIDNKCSVTEEMASLVLFKDTTTSTDLLEAVKKNQKTTLKWFSLIFVNVSGIATDGTLMVKRRDL